MREKITLELAARRRPAVFLVMDDNDFYCKATEEAINYVRLVGFAQLLFSSVNLTGLQEQIERTVSIVKMMQVRDGEIEITVGEIEKAGNAGSCRIDLRVKR